MATSPFANTNTIDITAELTKTERAAFKTLPVVISCGAVGGLAAAAVSRIFGVGILLKWPLYKDLPIEVFMGAVAALFGCYLLTSTDFHEVKGFVFAVACGVFWGPVITGAQSYMNQYASNQAVNQSAHARTAIEQATDGQASGVVTDAANSVSNALKQVPATTDPRDKQAIVDNAKGALSAVADNHNIGTPERINAITSIGLSSVSNGATDVGVQSVHALGQVAENAQNAATRDAAQMSLEQIVNEAQKSGRASVVEIGLRTLQSTKQAPPSH